MKIIIIFLNAYDCVDNASLLDFLGCLKDGNQFQIINNYNLPDLEKSVLNANIVVCSGRVFIESPGKIKEIAQKNPKAWFAVLSSMESYIKTARDYGVKHCLKNSLGGVSDEMVYEKLIKKYLLSSGIQSEAGFNS